MKGADLLIGKAVRCRRMIADRGYDANRIRAILREQGIARVIPGRSTRIRSTRSDEHGCKDHWRLRAMFCRLKKVELRLPAAPPRRRPLQ
jgi:transposase